MRLLQTGSVACFIASILHGAIIFGGPDWYRFFGAGEGMAQLAERGLSYPTVVTAIVAVLLGICGAYGLSGARVFSRLPFLMFGLGLISVVFLARGLAGVPIVLLVDDPYLNELESRIQFMVATSLISTGIGICDLWGFAKMWRSRGHHT